MAPHSKELADRVLLVLGILRNILLKVTGAAVGAFLALVIGARVTNYFSGPENYKIYVIGQLEVDSDIKDLFEAIKEGEVPGVSIDTKSVKIEKRDDKGDPHDAEQIAQEIAARNDTLLVVGHVFSTQTQAALPYYRGAQPPIPVILTTETNPNLLPKRVSAGSCPPAMRLSPTDDDQAIRVASFAAEKAKNFWVVADIANIVYSRYLTAQFVTKITDQGKRVVLQSTSYNVPPLETLKAHNIDGVFFAGDRVDALILIRQIRALTAQHVFPTAPHGPVIILSDWAVDNSLLTLGGKEVEGVFLTHPLTAEDYSDRTKGYSAYGRNAITLVQNLIREADREFSRNRRDQDRFYWRKRARKMHRVGDARAVLDEVMQQCVARPGLNGTTDCKYQRDADGKEENGFFHVWQAKGGHFKTVE